MVEATLQSLTEQVPLLDGDMFEDIGAILDFTEEYPKNMILAGALTVQQSPAKELEEQKEQLLTHQKEVFISTLKKQV